MVDIKARGWIDSTQTEKFEADLLSAVQAYEGNVTLDLTDVNYLGSGAFRALLVAQRSAKAVGGEVKLTGVLDRNREALELAGFTEIFKTV